MARFRQDCPSLRRAPRPASTAVLAWLVSRCCGTRPAERICVLAADRGEWIDGYCEVLWRAVLAPDRNAYALRQCVAAGVV